MASSGSITTSNSSGYRNVTFEWSVKSQNIANNTTTISWQIVGAQDAVDGWYYAGPFNLTINGTTVVSNLYPSGERIQLRKGTVVKTGETTISHNADGTKSFSATLSAAVYTLTAMTVSGSWALDTIPRQSSASVATSYNIGSSYTINITRASTAYYHRVSYKFGSNAETVIATNATTSATLNLSSWGSNIPAAMSADITVYLKTYPSSSDATNQTNQIGSTATYSTTFNIPSYTQGAPSATVAEANTANTTGVYVQSISKLKYTLSATANYGATLTYKVTVAGQTMTGASPLTTPSAINASGTVAATVTVTDSRGKTSSPATINTPVVAYSTPTITLAKAVRNATTKTTIDCTVSCSVSSILNGSTQKNTMTVYALYYTSTAPSPSSTYQVSTSGLSATNATKSYTGLSTSTVYYIQFRVVDIFGYYSQVIKVGTTDILHITAAGLGVLKRRASGALDVEGAAFFSGTLQIGKKYWNDTLAGAYIGTDGTMHLTSSSGGYICFHYANNANTTSQITESSSGTINISNNLTVNGSLTVGGKTPVYITETQTITGFKNFDSGLRKRSAGEWPELEFQGLSNNGVTTRTGSFGERVANGYTQFYFNSYQMTNGVQAAETRDAFWFPQSSTDGVYHDWNILTSKTVGLLRSGIGTSEVTLTNGYSDTSLGWVVRGIPGSAAYSVCFIPKAAITTSNTRWQVTDETSYITFNVRYSGNNLIIGVASSTTANKTIDIYKMA